MPMVEEVSGLLAHIESQKNALRHYQEQASPLYVLEARYTLFHLHRLLENSSNPSSLAKTLKRFLKKRWGWLNNTDAQYFHDTQNPANLMCVEVAKVLSKLSNQAYLLYLMPSLSNVPASAYVASSYEDDDLEFTELMLSDDGERLLHIPEILEYTEQDGVLKHIVLLQGQRCDLSLAEETRLLARHPSVANYYEAIRDKINFQFYGETAGAYLMRLIAGLREGGAHGSGTEFVAAEESNLAIVDFSIFLESLSKRNQKAVLKMGKFERWRDGEIKHSSIAHALELLVTSSNADEAEEQEERYCVELIANDLEEILEENPCLYQMMPFQQDGIGTLEVFQEAVEETKASMLTALNASKTYRYFGAVGDEKLARGVLSEISGDRTFFLSQAEIAYVARCYHHDEAAIKEPSESILLHARDYMKRKSLREALSDLPKHMSREVLAHVFPTTHRYRFYNSEHATSDVERVAKKPKHTYFSI
jgi:hypothetical protein